jgi:hypothetical protein
MFECAKAVRLNPSATPGRSKFSGAKSQKAVRWVDDKSKIFDNGSPQGK